MTRADQATILAGTVLILLWLNLFRLTLKDRRYIPRHRWTPTHRR